jgi:DNA repair protein RadC
MKALTTSSSQENNPVQNTFEFNNSYEQVSVQKFYIKEKVKSSNQLSTPEAVYNEMKELALADQESLWVIYVNTKNMILGKDMVSLGGIDSAGVDMRILFRRILLNNATSFFIVHNHPSNEIEPSSTDIKLTEKVKQSAELLQLRLLDHIIVAENSYYSFSSKGLI